MARLVSELDIPPKISSEGLDIPLFKNIVTCTKNHIAAPVCFFFYINFV